MATSKFQVTIHRLIMATFKRTVITHLWKYVKMWNAVKTSLKKGANLWPEKTAKKSKCSSAKSSTVENAPMNQRKCANLLIKNPVNRCTKVMIVTTQNHGKCAGHWKKKWQSTNVRDLYAFGLNFRKVRNVNHKTKMDRWLYKIKSLSSSQIS